MSELFPRRRSASTRRIPQKFLRLLGSAIPVAIAFFLLVPPALAQQHVVSGVVSDQTTGDPLPGVSVIVEGTTVGVATDIEGQYRLAVPDANGTLRYSYVGYDTQLIPIQGRNQINVALSSATLTGTEVVVVGYRTQQKQDLTGAVDVVDVQAMTELPSGQITRQLQGQASGVTVINNGQPGSGPMINIRGFNTFNNNAPLFVVDGVPMGVNDINPNDIESIQILKDAGAASIYGARASNGVVMITTRRGRGRVSISYDAQAGMQVPRTNNAWNILNPQEMADLKWLALKNSGTKAGTTDDQYGVFDPNNKGTWRLPIYLIPAGRMDGEVDESKYFLNPYYTSPSDLNTFNQIVKANQAGTDWYDEIFNPAPVIQNNITVSGGGDMGSFLVSAGYLNHQGVLDRTYNRRYNLRANSTFNIRKTLRVGENLAFSMVSNPTQGVLQEGSAIGMSYREQPIIPVHDIQGNFAGSAGKGMGNAANPVAVLERTRNNDFEDRRLFGNVFAEWDFLKGVTLRSSFGGSLGSYYGSSFNFPTYENSENSPNNQYNESSNKNFNWTWTTTVNSRHVIGPHSISFVAGTEAYRNSGRSINGAARGYFSFDKDFLTLTTGATPLAGTSSTYADALLSLIGRVDYSLYQKYLLSATVRRDGSSRFLDDRWGTFPGFSAGWRISQEPFLRNVKWLTDLKIRGGFGVMGNQLNVDASNAFTLYDNNPNYAFYPITGGNNAIIEGFRQNRIGNSAAVWEKTEDMNVGVDIALFRGTLEGTFDYYQKNIRDLLFRLELPATAGAATAPSQNVAKMKNTGFDMSLRHSASFGQLRLNTRITFTTYNNSIVQIAEGISNFATDGRRFGSAIIRNEKGHPISSYYGYDITGFWQNQAEVDAANVSTQGQYQDPLAVYQRDAAPGRFKFRDVNGDNRINADDRTFLGSPNPDYTYGLNVGLAYGAFDVSAFAYGVQGNEIWNQVRWWTDFYSSFQGAKSKTALYDSWTPENPNARAPIQENAQTFSTNREPTSYYVEDGSYLRLRSLQLGYTVPARLTNRIGLSFLRVYVLANDFWTISPYTGIDPEIGGNSQNFGIDEGAYVTPPSYTFGINVTL